MRERNLFFSTGSLDRESLRRRDPAALRAALDDPATLFIAVWQGRCLMHDQQLGLLSRAELAAAATTGAPVYLGSRARRHLFAWLLPDECDPALAERFVPLRGALAQLDAESAALFAYAKGMAEWHQRHRHCGRCGAPTLAGEGGFVLCCSSTTCGQRSYPRIDPAIIVLTVRDDRCLLGRQAAWPDGRYSTIAGFAEPGESLEAAVRREVLEETGVRIGEVRYFGSQPWPFPAALMIGFQARAESAEIQCHDGELADARWFDRATIAAGVISLPPEHSIAFQLIADWFDHDWPVPLARLDLGSHDFRVAGNPPAGGR